jgi:hypothetical protein
MYSMEQKPSHYGNPLKPSVHLNIIQVFGSYLTENTQGPTDQCRTYNKIIIVYCKHCMKHINRLRAQKEKVSTLKQVA